MQEEMFAILFSAIKTEIHGQKISSEVDPTYATILILSTLDTLLNPSPIIKNELNNIDINEYQDFKRDFIQFINKLLYK
ncbi:MAG: hypothetical protein NKF70_12395 [Methanobacterium sp. ERen5]|nr:MAG: hypothetical protein NKF70_12395 [Methanobacterium sp. ERen5]